MEMNHAMKLWEMQWPIWALQLEKECKPLRWVPIHSLQGWFSMGSPQYLRVGQYFVITSTCTVFTSLSWVPRDQAIPRLTWRSGGLVWLVSQTRALTMRTLPYLPKLRRTPYLLQLETSSRGPVDFIRPTSGMVRTMCSLWYIQLTRRCWWVLCCWVG